MERTVWSPCRRGRGCCTSPPPCCASARSPRSANPAERPSVRQRVEPLQSSRRRAPPKGRMRSPKSFCKIASSARANASRRRRQCEHDGNAYPFEPRSHRSAHDARPIRSGPRCHRAQSSTRHVQTGHRAVSGKPVAPAWLRMCIRKTPWFVRTSGTDADSDFNDMLGVEPDPGEGCLVRRARHARRRQSRDSSGRIVQERRCSSRRPHSGLASCNFPDRQMPHSNGGPRLQGEH